MIDKSFAEVARLFNQQWLSRYPRAISTLTMTMVVNLSFTLSHYVTHLE